MLDDRLRGEPVFLFDLLLLPRGGEDEMETKEAEGSSGESMMSGTTVVQEWQVGDFLIRTKSVSPYFILALKLPGPFLIW